MTAPALIPAPMAMRCPKCAAEMVTYERSGIHLEQCRECRGIFLDRGELERLVDAESGGAGWAGPLMNPPATVKLPLATDSRPKDRPGAERGSRTLQLSERGYLPEWFGDEEATRADRRAPQQPEAARPSVSAPRWHSQDGITRS